MPITANTVLCVGRALGTTPEFWLDLQWMYDLDIACATTDVSGITTGCDVSVHWLGE